MRKTVNQNRLKLKSKKRNIVPETQQEALNSTGGQVLTASQINIGDIQKERWVKIQ